MKSKKDFQSSIVTIDCQYLHPRFAASYLIIEGDRALFIDNNTAHCVPLLLDALKQRGLTTAAVDYIIITHVHLDHAGGTSTLLGHCPNATVLGHPRAVPHLIDPLKLVGSAKDVYGPDEFERLYGVIEPIPPSRVRAMQDSEVLPWGERSLEFIYTRGHANHHFCVYDKKSQAIFTGDSFGLAYPDLQKYKLFIFPSTSPTDFDPNLALESLTKIMKSGAQVAYLTHFGPVIDLPSASQQLKAHLEFSSGLLDSLSKSMASTGDSTESEAICLSELKAYYLSFCRKNGIFLLPEQWALLDLDLALNAQGIAYIAKKRANRAH